MNKVLAPIDFSSVTDEVIAQAIKLCKAFGSELVLMFVTPPHPGFKGCDLDQGKRWREVDLSKPGDEIISYAETADAGGVAVSIVVQQGPTVESILEISNAIDASWIVLGSHGHGALYDLLVGSTVEGVMSVSSIPTVIVPGRASA